MYEFTPFKKTDKLKFESFIQFSRELLNREEYKVLSPNSMLLYSILKLILFWIFYLDFCSRTFF